MGNQSDSKVTQSAQGSAGGDDPGGLQLLTQLGFVVNGGIATANTGGNTATGNQADNVISGGEQQIGDGPPPVGPVGVASITGDARNRSDGSAAIGTGPASAVGNPGKTALQRTLRVGQLGKAPQRLQALDRSRQTVAKQFGAEARGNGVQIRPRVSRPRSSGTWKRAVPGAGSS